MVNNYPEIGEEWEVKEIAEHFHTWEHVARRKPDMVANRIEEMEISDFRVNYIVKYSNVYRIVFEA